MSNQTARAHTPASAAYEAGFLAADGSVKKCPPEHRAEVNAWVEGSIAGLLRLQKRNDREFYRPLRETFGPRGRRGGQS